MGDVVRVELDAQSGLYGVVLERVEHDELVKLFSLCRKKTAGKRGRPKGWRKVKRESMVNPARDEEYMEKVRAELNDE